jgi:hypothetical protein
MRQLFLRKDLDEFLGDLPLVEIVVTSQFATITRPNRRFYGNLPASRYTDHRWSVSLTGQVALTLAAFRPRQTVLAPAIGGSVGNAVTQLARCGCKTCHIQHDKPRKS